MVALLEHEAESVEALAKAVIGEIDRLRADRTFYTVVTEHNWRDNDGEMSEPTVTVWANGLFSTPNQARSAVVTGEIYQPKGGRSMIVAVLPVSVHQVEAQDAALCATCGHGPHTHGVVPRVKGCVVGRRLKGSPDAEGAPDPCPCKEFVVAS